jgi:hypothetical protein
MSLEELMNVETAMASKTKVSLLETPTVGAGTEQRGTGAARYACPFRELNLAILRMNCNKHGYK